MTPDFALTPELLAFVKQNEGLVLHAYHDPVGLPTIGYGHRIPDMTHPPITAEQAEAWLVADLRVARDGAVAFSPTLEQAAEKRVSALTDFCFNAGVHAYGTSTLRRMVDSGWWPLAAEQMRRWVWGTKKGVKVRLPELVTRRETTAKWLEECPCKAS